MKVLETKANRYYQRKGRFMDYFEPQTVSEALSLLAKYGEEARVIAGGTDVLVDMKYKEEPECLINIK
jgi:CO/xanthine dehydrogenase FAD-binding subunit